MFSRADLAGVLAATCVIVGGMLLIDPAVTPELFASEET